MARITFVSFEKSDSIFWLAEIDLLSLLMGIELCFNALIQHGYLYLRNDSEEEGAEGAPIRGAAANDRRPVNERS